jgi:hypothetical protein
MMIFRLKRCDHPSPMGKALTPPVTVIDRELGVCLRAEPALVRRSDGLGAGAGLGSRDETRRVR